MHTRKTSITVPLKILLEIDKIAAQVKISGSGFITKVLDRVVKNIQEKGMANQINMVFSDQEVVDEQKKTSDAYLELIDNWDATKW